MSTLSLTLLTPVRTAACCIVRTVLNWQNVNSDPTWESVDNWHWRTWEIFIGIVTACIPALRPGYKVVSAGVKSYLSQRSSRKNRTLVDPSFEPSRKHADPEANPQHITHNNNNNPTVEAAAQAISAKTDHPQKYRTSEEGFAMNDLPGDIKTADQEGIRKKTTTIDVSGRSARGSQGGLELEDGVSEIRDFF